MKKNLNNEYVVAVVTKILMVIIGMAESIIIAHYLGANLNGQLAYISNVSQIIYVIMTLGIYTAYPYYRKHIGKENILDKTMSITIVMFILYAVLSFLISILIYNKIEWIYILCIAPILFYDKVISFIWMIENPNKRNAVMLISNLLKLFYYIIIYIFINRSLFIGVTTLIIAPIIESIYFTIKLKFKFSKRYLSKENLLQLTKYGLIPMITVLMTTLNYRIDVIMLKSFDNVSMASIGIYSIGLALAEKVFLVSDAVKEILLSKLAKGSNEKDVARVMRICFLISIVIAFCITIFSKPFIYFLYGKEYKGAEVIANITVWGTACMVFFKMISQYNVANKKQVYNIVFLIVSIITNIILNFILIPYFGPNGAAFTSVVGYLLSSILFLIYFNRISKIKYKDLIFVNKEDIKLITKKIKGNR